MHLYYADIIANTMKESLQPHCEIINVAGSVRRRVPEVKDIELVLIPKRTIHEIKNLFGEVIRKEVIVDPMFEKTIRNTGRVLKGQFSGRYIKLEVVHNIESIEHRINVDIFMPQLHDYWRIFTIRTGSSDFVKRFISGVWRRRGWVGTDDGLRLAKECYQTGEYSWAVKKDLANPKLPPAWQSEQDFFRWLGVQYFIPEHRNI